VSEESREPKPPEGSPRKPPGGSPRSPHYWESLVERQIRAAMDSGAFEDLPYQGERLPDDRAEVAGEWAMAHRVLRNAGMAPPWIEADKEVRHLLVEIEALLERAPRTSLLSRARERARLTELVHGANRAIARVNAEAPTTGQHRRPLDLEAVMRRLEGAFESVE
jgi:hypothetical protein